MRWRKLSPLAALGIIGACSADIPAPTAIAPVSGTTLHVSTNASIPNAVKYRDAGLHPATGRSGSASLEARALIGVDGITVVEATTGSLETGISAGTIAKAQLKVVGEQPGTQNFNNLSNGGYWSTTSAGWYRGQNIQVQANVRGVDPKRTDVVTVTTPVARRPDIAVRSVAMPSETPPNAPATITAVVAELNGDIGARANCVLSIDGTAVDSAIGIWVDAGGNVSCMFSHVFTAPGTYSASVSATNVNPGDWDGSNNSAALSVTVLAPGTPIERYSVMVSEQHYVNDNTSSRDGPYYFTYLSHQQVDYSQIHADGADQVFNPGPYQRIEVAVGHNGSNVYSATLTPQSTSYYNDGWYISDCSDFYGRGDWAQVCAYSSNGYLYTMYQYQHMAGTVTYYGSQFWCYPGQSCNSYTWNAVSVYHGGSTYGFTTGSTVSLDLRFVDANGDAHVIAKTLGGLNAYPINYSDSRCYTDSYGYYCSATTQIGYYVQAYVNW